MFKESKIDEFAEFVLSSVQSLSLELADVAGNVDDLFHRVSSQTECLVELTSLAQQLSSAAREIDTVGQGAQSKTSTFETTSKESAVAVVSATQRIGNLVDGVSAIEEQLRLLNKSLDGVAGVSGEIQSVAKLTNLLALNASIEAARAGESGRGFAVVAGEVKMLASQTATAAGEIEGTMSEVSRNVAELIISGGEARDVADNVNEGVIVINDAVEFFSDMAINMQQDATRIASAADQSLSQSETMRIRIEGAAEDMQVANEALNQADQRIKGILEKGEALVEHVVKSGRRVKASSIIECAQTTALRISTLFEEALRSGEITHEELFDEQHILIPGTDPEQYMTRFVEFSDRNVAPILDEIHENDSRIAFCAIIDHYGFMPSNIKKVSKKQRPGESDWNNSNCRNRRMLNDRAGLACGRNTKPFLLQTYRREMGKNHYVLMYDCSSPVLVNGKHWGGFRIGFLTD
ncbi:MAG: methyl-accepting chemotaxis protein [Granulosicoccus sp.]